MNANQNLQNTLEAWFSADRMRTYEFHADPEALYLWNTHLTKAFLEDIQHVEVLLRNRVHEAVSQRYGPRWYTDPAIPFDSHARKSIQKAERRARTSRRPTPPPGRVIAELSFDFWAYLFTNRYASTIWPLVRRTLGTMPTSNTTENTATPLRPSLTDFRSAVEVAYKLRNRCAHHEPIISRNRQVENTQLDEAQRAIELLATWMSPHAADWITAHSRVPGLRNARP